MMMNPRSGDDLTPCSMKTTSAGRFLDPAIPSHAEIRASVPYKSRKIFHNLRQVSPLGGESAATTMSFPCADPHLGATKIPVITQWGYLPAFDLKNGPTRTNVQTRCQLVL